MDISASSALRALIFGNRQAALGTLTAAGAPFVSMVLYALDLRVGAPAGALIHVSRLAAHTRQLHADPRTSLMVMQPATDAGDPQALARVTLECFAAPLPTDSADYATARMAYLARLPTQEYLFAFPDFELFRLELRAARYIGGFAQAFSLDAETLALALAG